MFPTQPFPLVPARLSGSRTAPRGSHVWLSQSSLRAPARGGGRGDRACVFCAWKRMQSWISRAALSVCFSSFGLGRQCEFQGSNYFWFVRSARKLKPSVMFWDSAFDIYFSLDCFLLFFRYQSYLWFSPATATFTYGKKSSSNRVTWLNLLHIFPVLYQDAMMYVCGIVHDSKVSQCCHGCMTVK